MNEELKIKIISVAYGDGSMKDKIEIWHLVKTDSECRRLYNEYKRTASSVHRIRLEECPDENLKIIYSLTGANKKNANNLFVQSIFGKPVVTAVASVIILAAVFFTYTLHNQPEQQNYTKQEVIDAEQQVKESLALVGKILNKTSKKIGNEIIPERVSKPIKQGVEIINQLFPKGVKQDENS